MRNERISDREREIEIERTRRRTRTREGGGEEEEEEEEEKQGLWRRQNKAINVRLNDKQRDGLTEKQREK